MSERTFGEILAEERERQGLTLAEVGSALRIRTDVLIAFESCDFSLMPHKGYSRNMISAYSRYLGLDSVAITNQFLKDYRAYSEGALPQSNSDYYRSSENTNSDKRLAGIGRSGSVRNRKTGEVVETEPAPMKTSYLPLRDQEWDEMERSASSSRRSGGLRRSTEDQESPRSYRRRSYREPADYEEEPFESSEEEEYPSYRRSRPSRATYEEEEDAPEREAPARRRVSLYEDEQPRPARRRVQRTVVEDEDYYEDDYQEDDYEESWEEEPAPRSRRARSRAESVEEIPERRAPKPKPQGRATRRVPDQQNRREQDNGRYAPQSRQSSSRGGGGLPLRYIVVGFVVVLLLVGVVSLVKGMNEDQKSSDQTPAVENTGIVTDTGSTAKSTDNILGSMSEGAVESIEKVVGPFTLKVVIPEGQETWLDIKVDGVYQVSGTIAGEKSYTFEVQEKCEVGTGNADVGLVYCNGSQVTLENINGMGYVALEIKEPEE